jgi:hypothetical protein
MEGYCNKYNCGYHTELYTIAGLGQFCREHYIPLALGKIQDQLYGLQERING